MSATHPKRGRRAPAGRPPGRARNKRPPAARAPAARGPRGCAAGRARGGPCKAPACAAQPHARARARRAPIVRGRRPARAADPTAAPRRPVTRHHCRGRPATGAGAGSERRSAPDDLPMIYHPMICGPVVTIHTLPAPCMLKGRAAAAAASWKRPRGTRARRGTPHAARRRRGRGRSATRARPGGPLLDRARPGAAAHAQNVGGGPASHGPPPRCLDARSGREVRRPLL